MKVSQRTKDNWRKMKRTFQAPSILLRGRNDLLHPALPGKYKYTYKYVENAHTNVLKNSNLVLPGKCKHNDKHKPCAHPTGQKQGDHPHLVSVCDG